MSETGGADAALRRRTLFWNAAGSLASAFQSFIFLAVVTRLCLPETADSYSLGISIAQLMWTVGTFEAASYQVTDAAGRFSSEHYLAFRILTCTLMVVTSIVYVKSFGFEAQRETLVLWLCAFKLIDAFAGFFYGLFQKIGRLDISGFALFWQYGFAIIAFIPTLYVTRDIVLSIMAATAAELIWDAPYYLSRLRLHTALKAPDFRPRAMLDLGVQVLPLFLTTFLANYLPNIPKYAIETLGVASYQSIFGIIFMPSFVVNLLALFILRPVLTSLSDLWHLGKRAEFVGSIRRLLLAVAGITGVVVLGGWLIGIPALQLLFSIDLSEQLPAFLIVLVGGGVMAANTVMYYSLIIFRRQGLVLIAYAVAVGVGMLIANPLVGAMGILGASICYALMAAVLFIAYLCVYRYVMSRS